MKNSRKTSLFIVLAFILCLSDLLAQTPVEIHGQLSVSGNKIVDKNGDPVQLRGMSLFWSQWMPKYYNANAVKWLKNDWCLSVIRVAMAADAEVGGYAKNQATADEEKGKAITVIDAAIAEGIYVIIDFHSHYANYPANKAAAKKFFGEISLKYKDVPNIIYEPWNEPIDVSWTSVIKPYHIEIIDTIRANDPDNIIVCGSRSWSQRVDQVAYSPINRTNIAYTLHFYANTHKQDLRDIATFALDEGIALFVTEYGTCDASGDTGFNEAETRTWWQFLDDNKISYCNWSVADKVETASALMPNADENGNWSALDLTESGTLVKADMVSKCENPTGILENKLSESEVLAFPNPFINSFKISCSGNFEYSILDLQGNTLSKGTGTNNVIAGDNLPAGIYMVKVSKGTMNKYIKAIKSN